MFESSQGRCSVQSLSQAGRRQRSYREIDDDARVRFHFCAVASVRNPLRKETSAPVLDGSRRLEQGRSRAFMKTGQFRTLRSIGDKARLAGDAGCKNAIRASREMGKLTFSELEFTSFQRMRHRKGR
jgi:hypothetical protein